MRRTNAHNGIILGIILGIAAGAYTQNTVIGIAVAIAASVLLFIGIRALERAIGKGIDKAGNAIMNKMDEAHKNKMASQNQASSNATFCPYCGAAIPGGAAICPSCGSAHGKDA